MKRKWIILVSSVAMQVCLGGIYAWSVFVENLNREYSLSMSGSQIVFGACIMTFTLSMVFAGKLLPRTGPRIIAGTGGILFGGGYILASFSGCFTSLFVGISLISGVGIGMAYVCPIVTCMKWFPENKGLVTGVTVAGFGAGAVVLSNMTAALLEAGWEVTGIFRLIGISYGLIVFIAAMSMEFPGGAAHRHVGQPVQPSPKILHSDSFRIFSLGIFCGTFAGLVVIGSLEPIGESWGMTRTVAVAAVSALAIGNGLGRITWGWIFDSIGMTAIPLSLIMLSAALMMFLGLSGKPAMFLLTSAFIGFCFGANFVVYAGAAAHEYGTAQVGAVYPFIFLAYGLSALVGPSLGGVFYDIFGNYRIILLLATVMPSLAAAVFIFKRKNPSPPGNRHYGKSKSLPRHDASSGASRN